MLQPTLLNRLNANQCIDTRWIAQTVGKQLKHVHEDVNRLFLGMVENFDLEQNQQGRVANYWLPLADAIYLVSTYGGERADKARSFIREAINFYIFQKPQLEAELAALRSQSHTRKQLTGARKGMMPVPIEQATLFGDMPVVRYVMMPLNSVSDVAKTKAQLRHIQRQMEGMARTVNKLQNRLDGC